MNKKPSASGETNSSGADVHLLSAPRSGAGRAAAVLAARVGILLGAVLAFALAVHLARAHDRAMGNAEAVSTERYTCPIDRKSVV